MHRVIPSSFMALLLALPAVGQTTSTFHVPSSAATKEGNAFDLRPFGEDRARTAQFIGGSHLWPHISFGKKLVGVSYRRDGVAMAALNLSRTTSPFWTVRLANWVPDPKLVENRYFPTLQSGPVQYNHYSIVFGPKQVTFPVLARITSGLAPFNIVFKFDRPVVYLGAGIVIDHFVYESRNRRFNYFIDAERSVAEGGKVTAFGTACPSGGNRIYATVGSPGGDPLRLVLFGGPVSGGAIGILGASNTRLGGINLPLDLTPFGLPGCSIYSSTELLFPVATNSNGSAQLELPVPPDKALAAAKFYGQWMTMDKRVNPSFPLAFSAGVELILGKSVGGGTVEGHLLYGTGNLGRSVFGFLDKGYTFVTKIDYQ
ncbi:MAG: hypothetical protein ACE5F1_09610 [Planctomycetota bacterium]